MTKLAALLTGRVSRRAALGGIAALAATPALADGCRIGPPPHAKGPLVWMDMDQIEVDAAYDQASYDPSADLTLARLASNSAAARERLGQPLRVAYGPTAIEKLDIYRAPSPKAPVLVFIHGGAWLQGNARDSAHPAEMFVRAGVTLVVPDFAAVNEAGGDLAVMAGQVRRSIAWTYKNAGSFGADRHRLYAAGHSSGGHLCSVALVTDWQKDFALPPDTVKGGLCMSGMYDMKPVRLSARSSYVKFTDAMEDAMSSQRHIDRLHARLTLTYGTGDTPEFQRQNRAFATAIRAAGKPVELIEAANFNHFGMLESLGNPYGPNGRAALAMMEVG